MKLVCWKYPPNSGVCFSFKIGPYLVVHHIIRAIGIQWKKGFIGIVLTEPSAPRVKTNLEE